MLIWICSHYIVNNTEMKYSISSSVQKLLSDSTKELLTSLINKWSSVMHPCCFTFILLINRIENTNQYLCQDYIQLSIATTGWPQIQEFRKKIQWQWPGYMEFKIRSNVYFIIFKIVWYPYFLSVKCRNTHTFFFFNRETIIKLLPAHHRHLVPLLLVYCLGFSKSLEAGWATVPAWETEIRKEGLCEAAGQRL